MADDGLVRAIVTVGRAGQAPAAVHLCRDVGEAHRMARTARSMAEDDEVLSVTLIELDPHSPLYGKPQLIRAGIVLEELVISDAAMDALADFERAAAPAPGLASSEGGDTGGGGAGAALANGEQCHA